MNELFARLQVTDFSAFLAAHAAGAADRAAAGVTDAGIYRDISDGDVVVVQLRVDDLGQARRWLSSPGSLDGGTIVHREVSLASATSMSAGREKSHG
jgi:hypothetical protein